MYLKHHTTGIVIGGRNDGLDSRRISLFTRDFGLLTVRVQGARTTRSKLRSGSQDFAFGEYSIINGKSGWRLVSARSEKNYFEIFRSFPSKLKVTGSILNLVKKLGGEEADTSLFQIVSNFLSFLERAKPQEVALAEALTLMRILHNLGYMASDPELSLPISELEIEASHLESIAPRRSQIIKLINQSLKAV